MKRNNSPLPNSVVLWSKIKSAMHHYFLKYFSVDSTHGTSAFNRHYKQCLHLQYTIMLLNRHFIFLVCNNSLSQIDVSEQMHETDSRPGVLGKRLSEGAPVRGHVSGGHLSGSRRLSGHPIVGLRALLRNIELQLPPVKYLPHSASDLVVKLRRMTISQGPIGNAHEALEATERPGAEFREPIIIIIIIIRFVKRQKVKKNFRGAKMDAFYSISSS